jgi:hypothetical protein
MSNSSKSDYSKLNSLLIKECKALESLLANQNEEKLALLKFSTEDIARLSQTKNELLNLVANLAEQRMQEVKRITASEEDIKLTFLITSKLYKDKIPKEIKDLIEKISLLSQNVKKQTEELSSLQEFVVTLVSGSLSIYRTAQLASQDVYTRGKQIETSYVPSSQIRSIKEI